MLRRHPVMHQTMIVLSQIRVVWLLTQHTHHYYTAIFLQCTMYMYVFEYHNSLLLATSSLPEKLAVQLPFGLELSVCVVRCTAKEVQHYVHVVLVHCT